MPTGTAEAPGGGGSPSASARKRLPRSIVTAACGAAVALVVVVSAVVRPWQRHELAEPAEPEQSVSEEHLLLREPEALAPMVAAGACSRPAAASAIAVLVEADRCFDAGELGGARDQYLDFLMSGVAIDDDSGEAVARWVQGRLALCVARVSRAGGPSLLDEPPLAFRGQPR